MLGLKTESWDPGDTQEPSGGALYFDSTAHRKLRYYRMLDDGVDANGHGSHCGGSAAGSPQAGGPGARMPHHYSLVWTIFCDLPSCRVCVSTEFRFVYA